jgi:hypothetical protein
MNTLSDLQDGTWFEVRVHCVSTGLQSRPEKNVRSPVVARLLANILRKVGTQDDEMAVRLREQTQHHPEARGV